MHYLLKSVLYAINRVLTTKDNYFKLKMKPTVFCILTLRRQFVVIRVKILFSHAIRAFIGFHMFNYFQM